MITCITYTLSVPCSEICSKQTHRFDLFCSCLKVFLFKRMHITWLHCCRWKNIYFTHSCLQRFLSLKQDWETAPKLIYRQDVSVALREIRKLPKGFAWSDHRKFCTLFYALLTKCILEKEKSHSSIVYNMIYTHLL